jgi:hypothetical protein
MAAALHLKIKKNKPHRADNLLHTNDLEHHWQMKLGREEREEPLAGVHAGADPIGREMVVEVWVPVSFHQWHDKRRAKTMRWVGISQRIPYHDNVLKKTRRSHVLKS